VRGDQLPAFVTGCPSMLLFTVCLLLSALALMAPPGLAVGAEPKARPCQDNLAMAADRP
jgi:hypothetical protein